MGFVSKTIRHTQRYTEIIKILIKYGMGDIVRSMKLAETFPFVKKLIPHKNNKPVNEFTGYEDIRMALEELGPTFIKFGQMLSNRPDIAPMPLIVELEKLQDNIPPFSYEEAVNIIEKDFGKPPQELFKTFVKKPAAAASISQVHKGTLHDGTHVAVKIRRPGIEETVSVDLEILHDLVSMAENNIERVKYFNLSGMVKEFEEHILQEMDFNHERYNLERFRKNFEKDNSLFLLKAYKEYSSKRVLTMDFIEGIKVRKIYEDNLENYDRQLIAKNGARVMLRQIFIDGYFHADPHPGNIMIMPDNKICFLDFGMMGTLMQSQKDELGALIVALMYRNSSMVLSSLLSVVNRPDHPHAREIEFEIQKLIERYMDIPLGEVNITEILTALLALIIKFELKMPSNFAFMVKALITIEGVGRQLDPDFRIIEIIRSFSKSIIRNQLSPKRFAASSAITLLETKKLIETAPRDLRELLHKAKQGHMKIEFEHRRLGKLLQTIEEASRRLVFGFTLGALIVGSSIMVHAGIAPKMYGIPIIGLIGFMISAIMAVYIIIATAIVRYRNWKKDEENKLKYEEQE
ncbi:MAG: AarF/UbiB family protein [Endomicrobia bacterium]|nr:AarF/UbiB family protein [Endomicrobiia bacterium]